MVNQLEVHLPYCMNWGASEALLEFLTKHKRPISSMSSDEDLKGLLMEPVLTIQRFLHLVEEAFSVVTTDGDKEHLEESKRTLLRYKTIVSSKAISKESFLDLLEADDQIHLNEAEHCLNSMRQVVKAGPLQLQAESRDEDSVIPKGKHQVFLFNDALLCTKKDKVIQREGRNVHRRDKKFREVC